MTIKQIAQKYGVTYSRIHYYIYKHDEIARKANTQREYEYFLTNEEFKELERVLFREKPKTLKEQVIECLKEAGDYGISIREMAIKIDRDTPYKNIRLRHFVQEMIEKGFPIFDKVVGGHYKYRYYWDE